MALRWRPKGKYDSPDEADKAKVVLLTSSDDEEANEDLSLAVIEKAKQSKGKRKTAEASFPLDEADLDNKETDKTGGEGNGKKKRVKKKKKERDVSEIKTPQVGISEEEPITSAPELCNLQVDASGEEHVGTVGPVLTEGNEVSDNKVLRRLLRGARYFDPGEALLEMCFYCGKEGHIAANCTFERKKKPCFRCGQFGHTGKDCTQGQYCYACRRSGHKAKDCSEKNIKPSEDSKVCLKCCNVGHDMFLCANDYPPEDMKEIQCYVCKKEGHLCCVVMSDSSAIAVSCYNCAELGHTGAGCAKPRRESGTVVSPILCYKCGEEGHFARGCRLSNRSIRRSVSGVTPKSKKSKMREREKKFESRSAQEGKKRIKRKDIQYDRKGSISGTPKSRVKGWSSDIQGDMPSSSSPNKYKPNSWGHKERTYSNSRDYSSPHSSEKRWQGYATPKSSTHWNQHKSRYSESRSHRRFAQS